MQIHLLDILQVLKIYRYASEGCIIYLLILLCFLECDCPAIITISLQWSPTEADVFASCSVDGTIAIWDIRKGKKPCISIKAHKDDVNVISWNRYIQWKTLDLMSTVTSAS